MEIKNLITNLYNAVSFHVNDAKHLKARFKVELDTRDWMADADLSEYSEEMIRDELLESIKEALRDALKDKCFEDYVTFIDSH